MALAAITINLKLGKEAYVEAELDVEYVVDGDFVMLYDGLKMKFS